MTIPVTTEEVRDEESGRPTCIILEKLGLIEEPICVPDRQETWVGWDGWVAAEEEQV